jgi:hypothetical protein
MWEKVSGKWGGGGGSVLSDTGCQFMQTVGDERRGEGRVLRREVLDVTKGKEKL